jgi:hypothetical protein
MLLIFQNSDDGVINTVPLIVIPLAEASTLLHQLGSCIADPPAWDENINYGQVLSDEEQQFLVESSSTEPNAYQAL